MKTKISTDTSLVLDALQYTGYKAILMTSLGYRRLTKISHFLS